MSAVKEYGPIAQNIENSGTTIEVNIRTRGKKLYVLYEDVDATGTLAEVPLTRREETSAGSAGWTTTIGDALQELLRRTSELGKDSLELSRQAIEALRRAAGGFAGGQAPHAAPRTEYPKPTAEQERKFRELVAEWKATRRHSSFASKMAEHPAYQQIISMGKPVVPLILAELERELDHWFIALARITGENPVTPEIRGKVQKMADAWGRWGKEHGLSW
jgi:hypothetical protein